MTAPVERTVASWEELRDLLEELASAGCAFRGQADARWPLESSLKRYLVTYGGASDRWLAKERKILNTFKRKAHLLLSRTPEPRETLEWFALMQHHGAPTRLLDFTWSPYVAAFFALERATGDAAIWAIASGSAVPNYGGSHISEILNRVLHIERSDVELATITPVVMGEPVLMNQRLTTQAGTFVIPTTNVDVSLENTVPASLIKVRLVTRELRRKTLDRLYNMNINNATLFPGIDGLARSLAFELEFEWSVDAEAARRLVERE
ncbi:MAG TPA: FRG domain-containing protein [Polyangiaceae bacterium]|nr:FRG domain-containing protein [Polyangiaceae bacterium]